MCFCFCRLWVDIGGWQYSLRPYRLRITSMTVLVAPPAPSYRVHPPAIVTVEYPGPVASSSKSQLKAVDTLGGIQRLTKALDNPHGIVELNFRPKEPFSHTVPGDTVRTKNMVVVKVIKRRRKRRKTKIVGHEVLDDVGVYKVESVGTVEKVVRFRCECARWLSGQSLSRPLHVHPLQ